MNYSEAAVTVFGEGRNCCQAVLTAFSEELGLDKGTALKIASAFGGGIGRTGEVCGAVSGALMALGLKYGGVLSKDEQHALTQKFIAEFKTLHSGVRCPELLETEIKTPEGRQKASVKMKTLCPQLVSDAANLAGKMMNEG